MDDFDLGKLLFGDHKCFHCERAVEDYEEHMHVPLNDYIKEEGIGEAMPGQLGDDATILFCSRCIVKSDEGYESEVHEIDVPDKFPAEWSA